MKSVLLATFVCLAAIQARAQITLEHSYPTTMKFWMRSVKVEGEGFKYYGFDEATRTVKVYNSDHTLWKTINPNIPSTAALGHYSVSLLSKRLFNLDTNVEVLIQYPTPGSYPAATLQVWNEAGLVYTFPSTPGHYISFVELAKQDSVFKLLVHHQPNTSWSGGAFTQVYNLTGTIPTGGRGITLEEDNEVIVYPSPTTSLVHVRFRQFTHAGVMTVRNTAGSVVFQEPLAPGSREAAVDMTPYAPGEYFFEAVEEGSRVARGRFEKL